MVPENPRRSAGTATSSVENDVIGPGIEREAHVILDMVCAYLETNRNAAHLVADLIGKISKIAGCVEIGKGGWGDRILADFNLACLGNLLRDLASRQMPTCAGLGRLP